MTKLVNNKRTRGDAKSNKQKKRTHDTRHDVEERIRGYFVGPEGIILATKCE